MISECLRVANTGNVSHPPITSSHPVGQPRQNLVIRKAVQYFGTF